MPECNERENEDCGGDDVPCASKRNIDVADSIGQHLLDRETNLTILPDDPQIIATVPSSPEAERRIVVGHAADHVFGRVDTVEQCP